MQRRYRIEWALLGVALLILGTSIGYWLYREHAAIDAQEHERLQAQARVIDENLGHQLKGMNGALKAVLDEFPPAAVKRSRVEALRHLKAVKEGMTGVRSMFILDAEGKVLAATWSNFIEGQDFSHRDYFKTPRERPDPAMLYVSTPFTTIAGTFSLNVSRAAIGPGGEFAGVVTATLDPEYFNTVLRSVLYAPDMATFIAHANGRVFVVQPENEQMLGRNMFMPGSNFSEYQDRGQTAAVMNGIRYATGEERLRAMRTASAADLKMDKPPVISVGRSVSAMFASWRSEVFANGGFFALFAAAVSLSLHLSQKSRHGNYTVNRLAAQALRASEEKLRAIFDTADLGVSIVDRNGRYLMFNSWWAQALGYDEAEMKGLTNLDITYSEDREKSKTWFRKLVEGEVDRYRFEKRFVRKDGSVFWADLSVSAVRDKDNGVASVVGMVTDITERKLVEAELHESESRFRSLTKMSTDFYWESDAEHRLTTRTESKREAAEQVLRQASPIGKRRWEVSYLSPDESGWQAHRAILDAHLPFRDFEISRLRVNGAVHHVSVSGEPVFNAAGEFQGYRGVGADITERKQAEAEIRRINAELELRVQQRTHDLQVANRELESFAYSVSHDLRAPLRAIEGFSRVLESEYVAQLDDTAKDYFRRIRGGATRMGSLIDDLLNLSRISRQEMKRGPVDLTSLAHEIADDLQGTEPERKVGWVISPKVAAEGDTGLLRSALQNLIGNAWKFSAKRETARIEFGISESKGRTAFFVRDNGEGFDMAYADKLFGAFQRLHSPGEFSGTGIGLATVKRIIHRHGGEIWAEGKVGEGAVFYFTL